MMVRFTVMNPSGNTIRQPTLNVSYWHNADYMQANFCCEREAEVKMMKTGNSAKLK